MAKSSERQRKKEEIPTSEWIVAGIGALLVALMLAVMLREALRDDKQPPVISFTVDAIVAVDAGYLAKITARNAGDETAAGLVIDGTLTGADGRIVESAEVVLDYLPGKSTHEIGLVFSRDPRQYRVSIHARGYQDP
jgi:uncharacterized protein (TIGR02588 family)